MRCYDEFFIMNGNHFFFYVYEHHREEKSDGKKQTSKRNCYGCTMWIHICWSIKNYAPLRVWSSKEEKNMKNVKYEKDFPIPINLMKNVCK